MDPDELKSAADSHDAASVDHGVEAPATVVGAPLGEANVEILTSEAALESGVHRARTAKPRRRKRWLSALAALVVLVGGGVATAVALLPSGGAQPEDVLPANTIAFVKLDLAPGLGQEIAAVRFLSHFPNTFKHLDSNDPVGSLLGDSARGKGADWTQIKPWLGNRFAFAVVPTPGGPAPVALVAITDEGKMRSYFSGHASDTKVAVADGFAILSNEQAAVDAVKSATSHLSGSAEYKADRAALGGEQILLAWGDLKPIYSSLQKFMGSLGSTLPGQLSGGALTQAAKISGRLVMGVHFTSSSVVATMLARGATAGPGTFTGSTAADLSGLPKDVLAAVSIAAPRSSAIDSLLAQPPYASAVQGLGFSAADVSGVLAGGLSIVVLPSPADPNTPEFAIRLRPSNVDAAEGLITSLTGGVAASVQMSVSGPYLYVGQSSDDLQDVIRRLAASGPRLGSTPGFQSAVPGSGVVVGYADLSKLIAMSPGAPVDAKALSSVGMVVKLDAANSSNGSFTLTLTTK